MISAWPKPLVGLILLLRDLNSPRGYIPTPCDPVHLPSLLAPSIHPSSHKHIPHKSWLVQTLVSSGDTKEIPRLTQAFSGACSEPQRGQAVTSGTSSDPASANGDLQSHPYTALCKPPTSAARLHKALHTFVQSLQKRLKLLSKSSSKGLQPH